MPDFPESLTQRMMLLGIREEEFEERFVLGTGSGGQKVNKTSSAVYLKHLPSGTEIKCQSGRSQTANRIQAREILCQKFEEDREERRQTLARKRARLRYQRRKPSPGETAARLRSKKIRSDRKKDRRKPGWSE